ncbi:MAG: hypothetical protein JXA99_01915 [Candidatus Lokiarchaeota archaeon]|nr:hypothetical protein [Candidatus Lokiarchaeota archaeon]
MKELEIDLFDSIDAQSDTLDFLEKKGSALDGIYRPKVDKKEGYTAIIRFLPNLSKDGKVLQSAIEKHQHYVDLKNYPDLVGYYDCERNSKDKCEICTEYWKLNKSTNAADVEKSNLIKRSTKYYSYVLIIEDKQNKELEGKIMIYPYGVKIKDKIKNEKDGNNTSGEPCNVFDLANGKNFKLVIKEVAGFPNYDNSLFMDISPIQINGKKAPVEVDEKTGKNKITNPKAKESIMKFLLDRTVELEDHKPSEWTSEQKVKVTQILEILEGNDVNTAARTASKSSFDNISTKESVETFGEDDDDAGDFFEIEE